MMSVQGASSVVPRAWSPATALAAAKPSAYWTDRSGGPTPAPSLRAEIDAELVVVGGGFTGLWTAVQALEDNPGRRVVLLEAESVGSGASTRNGGMLDESIAHGAENAHFHWPDEAATLVRLGKENFAGLRRTLETHDIGCDFRPVSWLDVATEPWQLKALEADIALLEASGDDVEMLDAAQLAERIVSPTFIGALLSRDYGAIVDPAELVWGLLALVTRLGGVVYEHSKVTGFEKDGNRLKVSTAQGVVRTDRVVVATNAYPGPVRAMRRHVIPVFDHVLMTEPLNDDQQQAIKWHGWEGVDDAANQFHYFRRTADGRILWGGYDATYHYGSSVDASHEQSETTHSLLAEQFFATFPQLEGLNFSHRWGGPIGTTTRFTCSWGTKFDGRFVWVGGYTGLGVAASRFGARVALDLVDGVETERTELSMVRSRPFPFPPEPIRAAAVAVTKRSIQNADANEGRENLWLKALGKLGVGFDT